MNYIPAKFLCTCGAHDHAVAMAHVHVAFMNSRIENVSLRIPCPSDSMIRALEGKVLLDVYTSMHPLQA